MALNLDSVFFRFKSCIPYLKKGDLSYYKLTIKHPLLGWNGLEDSELELLMEHPKLVFMPYKGHGKRTLLNMGLEKCSVSRYH